MTASMTRAFKPLLGHADPNVAILSGYWAIGATGAVGTKTGATGLKLTRTNTGLYTIQLQAASAISARVPAILWADFQIVNSDTDPTDDTDAVRVRILAFDASAGTISIQCVDEGDVAREIVSGGKLMATVHVKMSSAVR